MAERLTISWAAMLLIVLPLILLSGTEFVLGFWGDPGVVMNATLIEDRARLELVARYRAFAAFVFFVTVAVAVTAIFAWDLLHRFKPSAWGKVVVTIVFAIGFTMVFSVFEPEQTKSFETYQLLGEDLFREGLGTAKTSSCAPTRALCEYGTSFDAVVSLVDFTNIIVALATACALIGILLALGRDNAAVTGDAEAEALEVDAARNVAKRYLYCTGVLLTAGMLWVQAWMSWPATLIADEGLQKEFSDLVASISLFRGTTYTLLILSVYLPVSLVLATRMDAARQQAPECPVFNEEDGLARISYTESLKTIAAILAPILMGVLGSSWNVSLGL